MFKIRFHLGAGKRYRHWQIKCLETGNKIYLHPNEKSILMDNCQLVNNRNIAEKIYSGEHKTVCAWILCEQYFAVDPIKDCIKKFEIKYNPKINPYWTDSDNNNLDQFSFSKLKTSGNKVFSYSINS